MRLPRVRLTIRQLLVALVIVALTLRVCLWSVEMWRRSYWYGILVVMNADSENHCRSLAQLSLDSAADAERFSRGWETTNASLASRYLRLADERRHKAAEYTRHAEVWAARKREYQRVATFPWLLPVPPDLPPPE